MINQLIDKPINFKFSQLPQINELQNLIDHNYLHEVLISKLQNPEIGNGTNTNYEYKYDLLIENQRGVTLFGIPLFLKNGLLPILDPSNFQLINGQNYKLINDLLINYPLPDLNWSWYWDNWYILMLNDVDDQGWIYSKIDFQSKHWKGKYYFGNFVRRRIWVRLRRRNVDDA